MPEKVKAGLKWNTLSAFLQAALKVVRGLLIPKILPSIGEYGLFTSVNLYTRYLNFTDLGSKEYLLKRLPKLFIENQGRDGESLISDTLTFQFFTLLGVSVYLLFSALLYSGENQEFYKVALLLLIPVVVFARGKDLLSIIATSQRRYAHVARTQMVLDISSLVLTVAGIIWKGAIGGVLGMLCANVAAFLYIHSRVGFSYKFSWSFLKISRLKSYWSLFSVYFLDMITNSYDLLVILLFYSVADYGLYSFGQIFIWVMIAISGILQSSLYPKIFSVIKSELEELKKILNGALIVYLALCATLLPFLCIGTYLLLTYYLDKYNTGLYVYYLMLISALFRGMNVMMKLFFIAENREATYRKIVLVVLLLTAALVGTSTSVGLILEQIVGVFVFVDGLLFLLLLLLFKRKRVIIESHHVFLLLMGSLGFITSIMLIPSYDNWWAVLLYIIAVISLCGLTLYVLYRRKTDLIELLNM